MVTSKSLTVTLASLGITLPAYELWGTHQTTAERNKLAYLLSL